MPYIPIAKARGFTAGFGKRKHYYISKYIPRNFLTHNKIHAKNKSLQVFSELFLQKTVSWYRILLVCIGALKN